jgi:RNA polymerase sigma-70 factor (ECF subfamily)
MNTFDQKELIRNLKNGSEESFSFLYGAYGKKIYNLAYRMIGNPEDAEDITQETFLQAYRHIENFNEESHIYTWLYTITKNSCYRVLQNQKKNSFTSLESLIHTAQDHQLPKDITDREREFLINQIKEGCLTGLLRRLSFYQRVAFILHVLVHLPIREVAEILDKSEGATKVLIHRARQNLKGFLCKNCSLYDKENSCRCENLISFSLNQGWISRPSKGTLEETSSIQSERIEAEIEHVRRIAALYDSLADQKPPENLSQRIQHVISNQDWAIFHNKKLG